MSDKFNLEEARNKIVAKDNRLIQESRYSLSLVENKAILYLISQIQLNDTKDTIYKFNCREFQALLTWTKETSYQNIKNMIQNIADRSFWVKANKDGREKEVLIRWLDIVRMDMGNGDIDIRFHEDMFPYLLELQKHFKEEGYFYTTYKLQNVTLMKHKYSIKLYELLKSYQFNNKKWTFENGTKSDLDLQIRLASVDMDKKTRKGKSMVPEGWANWAIFKRNVLDVAIDEINKYTDIKVAYEGKKEDMQHRKTRAIRTIEFYMLGKTNNEQKTTNEIIDKEYIESLETKMTNLSLSIEEKFFKAHEDALVEEKEKIIEASKHPILYECLEGEYLEEEVCSLYDVAIKGRVAGYIKVTYWEMFATDIITYYNNKIKSTSKSTKTTKFNRLYDMVLKDYDEKTIEIRNQYMKK